MYCTSFGQVLAFQRCMGWGRAGDNVFFSNWAGMVTGCVAFGFVNLQAPRTCNKDKKKSTMAATYHLTTP